MQAKILIVTDVAFLDVNAKLLPHIGVKFLFTIYTKILLPESCYIAPLTNLISNKWITLLFFQY